MPALAEPEAEKVLCLRDRLTDRQAAPVRVFAEAVEDPSPALCQGVLTRLALNTLRP